MKQLSIFLLGSPRIELDNTPVEIRARKAIALIAYLAVAQRQAQDEKHSRDTLAALFWPEYPHDRARAALRSILWLIKKTLGQEWLYVDRESIGLQRSNGLWVDVDHFERLLTDCHTHDHVLEDACFVCLASLTEAANLYRDDFMIGFSLPDSASFDDWQLFQSQDLHSKLSQVLEGLVKLHAIRQEFDLAIVYARRWLAFDPLHESAHRYVMQLYAQTGRQAAASRQYQKCVRILKQELGVSPSEETTRLYQAIHPEPNSQPVDLIPARSHNLPQQLTPFVGRQQELSEIARLFGNPDCRLLTLTGPGGVGKTRLAIQAAAQAVAQEKTAFSTGACFVSLADLKSADLLATAIVDALRFAPQGTKDARVQLVDYLRHKEILLVLDNFEHLAAGSELLAEILENTAGVKLLVTSREHLCLEGEWLLEVQGLSFPHEHQPTVIEEYNAVRLFLQSARRIYPDFKLTEQERPFVGRLCRFLEGLPLGIELAAAWVRVLSCQEIAQEIERSLGFLTYSSRNVPERHRSLRAVFDHSWRSLSEQERDVLKRLSVFRGGFKRAAAERVAQANLHLLFALARKSFLRRNPQGRFEMLEVVRQYAEEKLQEVPRHREETHDLHCEYYAGFLHQRESSLRGATQIKVLEEIGAEIENVRAGWRWAVARWKKEAISQSIESLGRFYEMRGWFREGEKVFRAAAEKSKVIEKKRGSPQDENRLVGARILTRQGMFCHRLSHFQEAKEILLESLSLLHPLEEQREKALVFRSLGVIALHTGEYAEAKRWFQKSQKIHAGLDDKSELAICLNNLGLVARWVGEYNKARQLFEKSLAINTEIADSWRMASNLVNLGMIAGTLGENHEAERFFQQSLTVYREIGAQREIAICLGNLGFLFATQGKHNQAKTFYQQSVSIYREIGYRLGVMKVLNDLGITLGELGEYRAAEECFQEALETGLDLQIVHVVLTTLTGGAMLLAKQGAREQAVEIASCVLLHPLIPSAAKDCAERLLAELESELDPHTFALARERGKASGIEHYTHIYKSSRLEV